MDLNRYGISKKKGPRVAANPHENDNRSSVQVMNFICFTGCEKKCSVQKKLFDFVLIKIFLASAHQRKATFAEAMCLWNDSIECI